MSIEIVREERERYAGLTGIERAGTITNAVAWRLRGEGYGLVEKTSGSNWQGRSADLLMLRDGRLIDILGDSEGECVPQWSPKPDAERLDPARWRSPVEPPVRPQEPPFEPPIGVVPVVEVKCSCGLLDALPGLLAEVVKLRVLVEEMKAKGVPVRLSFK